jgi:hypothetical protein
MIRALLDGRKTQTRRVLKPQPEYCVVDGVALPIGLEHVEGRPLPQVTVGRVMTRQEVRFASGDRLWVRETVACGACAPSRPAYWAPSFWHREQGTPNNPSGLWYKADGLAPEKTITERGKWVPAIHMPRWASRLTLTVESVKVERLHEITDADAKAEGVRVLPGQDEADPSAWWEVEPGQHQGRSPRRSFRKLWEAINGEEAWLANPWVACIGFRSIHANIDAPELAGLPRCRETAR